MTSGELVHAALWLVVTLGSIAGCFVLVTAEFVAGVQVLVYVGSVVVLVIFALMLTRQPAAGPSAEVTGNRWVAALLGLVATIGLGATVIAGFHGQRIEGRRIGTAASIGDALFHDWVLPFEVLSGVLLAALIGAIVISRSGSEH
ncbi:MAG: NADH-quinone oxidoreductase subunit J [Flavobacterium sp.]|nr:NADH-quinone oxidoreductase subunit J [Aeromicrobium sp.]